jgi:hypothetical protein
MCTFVEDAFVEDMTCSLCCISPRPFTAPVYGLIVVDIFVIPVSCGPCGHTFCDHCSSSTT